MVSGEWYAETDERRTLAVDVFAVSDCHNHQRAFRKIKNDSVVTDSEAILTDGWVGELYCVSHAGDRGHKR